MSTNGMGPSNCSTESSSLPGGEQAARALTLTKGKAIGMKGGKQR